MTQVYRGGQLYGTGHPERMTPHEVRTREFSPRRRGVDRDEVRHFQLTVAEELSLLHKELALTTRENDRLKRALRDWQTRYERNCQSPFSQLRDPDR